MKGQSMAAIEEGDHAPAPLPEEQHRSQPGPLIIAECSQLVPVTNKTSLGAHSATDRGEGSPGKGGNKALSPPRIRAHPELPMATATAKLQQALCRDVTASSFPLTPRETFSWLLNRCCPGTEHFISPAPRSYPGGCRFNIGLSGDRVPGCCHLEPAGPRLLSSGMGRNSEGELLLVTAGPVGGQGLATMANMSAWADSTYHTA